jgi:hypothetical protein
VDRVHRILSNPLKELLHRPPLKVHIPHPTPEIKEISDNEKEEKDSDLPHRWGTLRFILP